VELAELGQFGEECAGQCLADTGDRSEQILLGAPDRRAAHHRVDVAIDLVELLLEGSDKSGQALAHPRIEDALLAMALGDDHLDDLPASGHKLGEQRCRFVGNGTRLWFYRLGEVRDHGRIDGIGLRALADSFGELTHLRGIHHGQWKLSSGDRRRDNGLEAASGFDRDQRRDQSNKTIDQLFQALAIPAHRERFCSRSYMHVQPIFRHIDTDKDRVHLNPSLRNRASAAARATVRVRWNDGRIPVLRNGLMGPRTRRSSVRHRVGQISRSGAIRLTRMRPENVESPFMNVATHDPDAGFEPAFAAPPDACDAHFHVFGPAERYAYCTDIRYKPPYEPLEAYLKLANRLGFKRYVFVQPSAYGFDNSCMLDAMRELDPKCRRGIIDLDETKTRDKQ